MEYGQYRSDLQSIHIIIIMDYTGKKYGRENTTIKLSSHPQHHSTHLIYGSHLLVTTGTN
jgi:hypothetical protein